MNAPGPSQSGKSRNALLVLEAAIDALAATTGIIGKIQALAPATGHGTHADADVELYVEGVPHPYLVEIKAVDRLTMLRQVKQRFAEAPRACLLVAPRISAWSA